MSIDIKYPNTQVKLKATVVTPMHVGGATEDKWQPGLEYIYANKLVYILDTEKLFLKLPIEDVNRLSTDLSLGNFQKISEYLDRNHIQPKEVSLQSFRTNFQPKDEIFRLIRTGTGIPYIPGSSLKGAIRSVLGSYIMKEKRIPRNEFRYNNDLNKAIFGNITQNIMRFLQIGDLQFDNQTTHLTRTKTFNLQERHGKWKAGWKHANRHTDQRFKPDGFVFTYEHFPIGATASCRIKILDGLQSFIQEKKGRLPENLAYLVHTNPIQHLLQMINAHTEKHLKREYNFLIEYDEIDESDAITDAYEALLDNHIPIDKNNSCLIRLAAGSGFHSITGDWQYEDHDKTGFHQRGRHQGKKKFKSRKLAFTRLENGYSFMPMGFLKLEIES